MVGNGNLSDIGNAYNNSCRLTKLIIPKTYNGYPITEIGPAALQDKGSLTSLVILAPITKIHQNGIRNLRLTQLVLPPTLTTIEETGIYDFDYLNSIIFPYGTNFTNISGKFLGYITSTSLDIIFCGTVSQSSYTTPFYYSTATINVYVPNNYTGTFFGKTTVQMSQTQATQCYLSYYSEVTCPTCKLTYTISINSMLPYIAVFLLL